MNSAQLYNALTSCGLDEYLEFKYGLFVPHAELSGCIKNILLQNNLLHLQQEDGFSLTEEEIQDIYPDVMLYAEISRPTRRPGWSTT